MRVLELQRRNAAHSGTGTWTCNIDGGLELQSNQQVQVLKSFIHIPGSTSESSAIVVEQQMTATIEWCYWARALDEMVDPGSPLANWLSRAGTPLPNQGDKLYLRAPNHQLVKDRMTITVQAGLYSPARLAENITEQLRAQTSSRLGDLANGAVVPNGRRPTPNTQTWRGMITRDGGQPTELVFASTDYDPSTAVGQALEPTAGANHRYQFGTDIPAVVWLEEENRFQLKYLHAQIHNDAGEPSVLRGRVQGHDFTQIYGSTQGIGVTSFGFTEATWESSIWFLLGFSYADLGAPAAASDTGLTTDQAIQPAFLTATPNNSNSAFWDVTESLFITLDDNTDETTGPIASTAPQLGSTAGGYWRVLVDIMPVAWNTGDGKRVAHAMATADRSYASGDVYVGQAGEPVQFTSASVKNVGSITCTIIDPATGQPETSLGEESAVLLAIA